VDLTRGRDYLGTKKSSKTPLPQFQRPATRNRGVTELSEGVHCYLPTRRLGRLAVVRLVIVLFGVLFACSGVVVNQYGENARRPINRAASVICFRLLHESIGLPVLFASACCTRKHPWPHTFCQTLLELESQRKQFEFSQSSSVEGFPPHFFRPRRDWGEGGNALQVHDLPTSGTGSAPPAVRGPYPMDSPTAVGMCLGMRQAGMDKTSCVSLPWIERALCGSSSAEEYGGSRQRRNEWGNALLGEHSCNGTFGI
jgi:hypothetical protein